MARFMIQFTYSSGSWARMLMAADDRTSALRTLTESLGGCLETVYWDLESCAAFAITSLPDSVTAAAILTATARTGAFTGVKARELLTQEQLHAALMMARDVSRIYRAPGGAAFERDLALGDGEVGRFVPS